MNKKTIVRLYPQLRGPRLSSVQLVSLHLLLHKPVGEEDSRDPVFGPYISTLPRNFSSHPLTWMVKRDTEEDDAWERAALRILPPSILLKLSVLYGRFRTDWRAVAQVLVRALPPSVQDKAANRCSVPSSARKRTRLWLLVPPGRTSH